MASVAKHLDGLLGSSEAGVDRGTAGEWTRISKTTSTSAAVYDNDTSDEEESGGQLNPWSDSVLSMYLSDGTSSPQPPENTWVSLLYQKPDAEHLIQSLQAILASNRSNEAISAELAELLGFDEIDLIMGILNDRASVTEQLNGDLTFSTEVESNRKRHAEPSETTDKNSFSADSVRRRMQEQFEANAARPLFTGVAQPEAEVLPHVYTSSNISQGNVVSQYGSKYMLPLGTTRQLNEIYEEVVIPPTKPVPPKSTERLIPISELDEISKGSFPGYASLNRIQSIVYPTAYGSNENLLICAPTGAGKTDVAMLTILRVIDQHRLEQSPAKHVHVRDTINRDAFKIIYVAPMKALASEIVRKLGKRLAWLSIEVRELTGDMQLTRAEIARTQVIVTTPEKWDVVTRKPTGEGELSSSLKLLIIDEVHLLNEERGAVIETIVARTLRQVESSQSMIRIVGLSATLPNYKDVAEFLCASHYKGLFYFDSSFRPVPLEQHFLGIKGKPGSAQSRKNLDQVTFDKVSELVAEGHQVMVFVHARKETVKAAMSLKEMSMTEGNTEHFSCEDHPQWSFFRQRIGESRNKEMKELFDSGFGIHHAGMLRSDRNMMERMFEAKAIKVLCCTATLAWGVNLPAHAVIIKGTQVYDSSKGKFVDLSVLDVLQVFGRAGRPGMETSGEGYICTTEDKLTHYLDAVTSQIPIESQFQAGLMDSLNAEVSLGTVANIRDAVQWLGYTYLFVRMRMNPFVYGIAREAVIDDPQLGGRRNELINIAAQKLAANKMINTNERGQFQITDLGRIAAKYYIRHTSIEIFNKEFKPKMSEADVLAMLSMSTEFAQIQIRESEIKELQKLMENAPCQVMGGTDTSAGKVNILLQGYISREMVEDFALVSDMAYVAQNGGRIIRALLEIAVSKKWANVTAILMAMSKAIESRLWPYDHPLRQFNLKADTMFSLEKWADDWSISQLAELDASSLGTLVHMNETHGHAILAAAKQFPTVQITYILRPIAADVLKISFSVKSAFSWNPKIHGTSEPFWIWIEDLDGITILQFATVLFHQNTEALELDFFIPISNGQPPPSITVRAISDRWVGAEDVITISLDSLVMPSLAVPHTPLLNLPFLHLKDTQPSFLSDLFPAQIQTLNAMQSQAYWNFIHNKTNSLLCAPTGSGKSTLAQMAIWSTILQVDGGFVLAITPTRVAALEMASELQPGSQKTGIVLESGGDPQRIFSNPKYKSIRVVSADQLLHALSNKKSFASVKHLHLVVCDGLEQLDPAYELSISLLRLQQQTYPTRFIGVSAALNDASDLANWLGVDPLAVSSFRPQDREQALVTARQSFSVPYSAALFKAMAKPAHLAIQNASRGASAIIFVPSRGQCRPIALDLITRCTLETESGRGYIPEEFSDDIIGDYCARLQDTTLLDFVQKGVGFFYSGVAQRDRLLMLDMFAEGIIRVLVVPKDSCWILPIRATVVIAMGTQYVHVEDKGASRQIRDYSLTEVVRMQSRAIQQTGTGFFHLLCQAEALETYSRFLDDGLPLESQLSDSQLLRDWISTFSSGYADKQRIVDALSFTFLSHRVTSNPSYYGFNSRDKGQNISAAVDHAVDDIHRKQKAPSNP